MAENRNSILALASQALEDRALDESAARNSSHPQSDAFQGTPRGSRSQSASRRNSGTASSGSGGLAVYRRRPSAPGHSQSSTSVDSLLSSAALSPTRNTVLSNSWVSPTSSLTLPAGSSVPQVPEEESRIGVLPSDDVVYSSAGESLQGVGGPTLYTSGGETSSAQGAGLPPEQHSQHSLLTREKNFKVQSSQQTSASSQRSSTNTLSQPSSASNSVRFSENSEVTPQKSFRERESSRSSASGDSSRGLDRGLGLGERLRRGFSVGSMGVKLRRGRSDVTVSGGGYLARSATAASLVTGKLVRTFSAISKKDERRSSTFSVGSMIGRFARDELNNPSRKKATQHWGHDDDSSDGDSHSDSGGSWHGPSRFTRCLHCLEPLNAFRSIHRCRSYALLHLSDILAKWVRRAAVKQPREDVAPIHRENSSLSSSDVSEATTGDVKRLGERKAEDAFRNELADALWTQDPQGNLADAWEYPWQEYFIHRNGMQRPTSLWQYACGIPTAEYDLLHKVRIKPTTSGELKEFLTLLKGGKSKTARDTVSSQESYGSDADMDVDNDLSQVLGDSSVDWSYYDLFERKRAYRNYRLISSFSLVARWTQKSLWVIAYFSVWFSTLAFCFREVIKADQHVGPSMTAYIFCEALDVVFDGVYFLGVLSLLRTTIVDADNFKEENNPHKIFHKRITSPLFWADLLTSALTPVRFAFGRQSEAALRIGVAKVVRAWRLLPGKDPVRSSDSLLWSMLHFVVLLLSAGHICGCIWFLVTESAVDVETHPLILQSAPDRVAEYDETPWALYLYYSYATRVGVYMVLGLDWLGMSSAESLLAVLSAPMGALISAFVFSQVIVMMQRSSALKTMYAQHVIEVKQALNTLDLPRYLQLRILAFYAYQQLHRSEHTSHSLRRGLSKQLHFELHLVLYYGLVKKSRLFQSAPPKVIRDIVVTLKDRIFLPGDFVYRARDEASDMFFICKGNCSVVNQDLKTVAKTLQSGESFGEIPLLCGNPHNCYIRADTYCILATLSKGPFHTALERYPKMVQILVKQMSQQERELLQRRTNAGGFGQAPGGFGHGPRRSLTGRRRSSVNDGGFGGLQSRKQSIMESRKTSIVSARTSLLGLGSRTVTLDAAGNPSLQPSPRMSIHSAGSRLSLSQLQDPEGRLNMYRRQSAVNKDALMPSLPTSRRSTLADGSHLDGPLLRERSSVVCSRRVSTKSVTSNMGSMVLDPSNKSWGSFVPPRVINVSHADGDATVVPDARDWFGALALMGDRSPQPPSRASSGSGSRCTSPKEELDKSSNLPEPTGLVRSSSARSWNGVFDKSKEASPAPLVKSSSFTKLTKEAAAAVGSVIASVAIPRDHRRSASCDPEKEFAKRHSREAADKRTALDPSALTAPPASQKLPFSLNISHSSGALGSEQGPNCMELANKLENLMHFRDKKSPKGAKGGAIGETLQGSSPTEKLQVKSNSMSSDDAQSDAEELAQKGLLKKAPSECVLQRGVTQVSRFSGASIADAHDEDWEFAQAAAAASRAEAAAAAKEEDRRKNAEADEQKHKKPRETNDSQKSVKRYEYSMKRGWSYPMDKRGGREFKAYRKYHREQETSRPSVASFLKSLPPWSKPSPRAKRSESKKSVPDIQTVLSSDSESPTTPSKTSPSSDKIRGVAASMLQMAGADIGIHEVTGSTQPERHVERIHSWQPGTTGVHTADDNHRGARHRERSISKRAIEELVTMKTRTGHTASPKGSSAPSPAATPRGSHQGSPGGAAVEGVLKPRSPGETRMRPLSPRGNTRQRPLSPRASGSGDPNQPQGVITTNSLIPRGRGEPRMRSGRSVSPRHSGEVPAAQGTTPPSAASDPSTPAGVTPRVSSSSVPPPAFTLQVERPSTLPGSAQHVSGDRRLASSPRHSANNIARPLSRGGGTSPRASPRGSTDAVYGSTRPPFSQQGSVEITNVTDKDEASATSSLSVQAFASPSIPSRRDTLELEPTKSPRASLGGSDVVASEGRVEPMTRSRENSFSLDLPSLVSPPKDSSADFRSKAQHNLSLIGEQKETVTNATRAMRHMLRDLKLVANEMLDLTKAAEGVHQELNDALVKETIEEGLTPGSEIVVTEPEEEYGGFGTFEVQQSMDELKWQVLQLQNIAAQVGRHIAGDTGASDVIRQAIASSNETQMRRGKSQRFSSENREDQRGFQIGEDSK